MDNEIESVFNVTNMGGTAEVFSSHAKQMLFCVGFFVFPHMTKRSRNYGNKAIIKTKNQILRRVL